jgi:hypothetical protein
MLLLTGIFLGALLGIVGTVGWQHTARRPLGPPQLPPATTTRNKPRARRA